MLRIKKSKELRWPPLCRSRMPRPMSNNSLKLEKLSRKTPELTMSQMGYTYQTKEWEKFQQIAKRDVKNGFEAQVDSCRRTDLNIHIGSKIFKCHLWVLNCYTDYFRTCNHDDEVDITETEVTPDAFFMVYQWMRSHNPILQPENCLALFHAAFVLKVSGLLSQFWEIFLDAKVFSEIQAFSLYLEAAPYVQENMIKLRQVMLTRIQRSFLTLVASNDFLKLSAAEVSGLLKLDSIGVNTEIEVFLAVVRWANHNWNKRALHVEDIIKCCIRFSLMSMANLMALSQSPNCNEVQRIAAMPQVNALINNGLCYTSAAVNYGPDSSQFEDMMQRLNLVEPRERIFVFDVDCQYHHCTNCPAVPSSVVTYKMFTKYLDIIQIFGQNYWHDLRMADQMDGVRCCVPLNSFSKKSQAIIAQNMGKS